MPVHLGVCMINNGGVYDLQKQTGIFSIQARDPSVLSVSSPLLQMLTFAFMFAHRRMLAWTSLISRLYK